MSELLRVLLIEDCEDHVRLVELLLGRSQDPLFEVVHVDRLSDAIRSIHEEKYDVVLLDLGLPDSEGLEAVKRLKSASPESPIVVLTASDDEQLAIDSIIHGAQEFLSKEYLVADLVAKVIRHSIARQKQLMDAQSQALNDALTGIPNRRCFDLEMERRVAEAQRSATSFGVVVFDVDHFKRFNDTHGHEVGDTVLKTVAGMFDAYLRASDLAARIGGEEFAIAIPTVDAADVLNLAERIRGAVEATQLSVAGRVLSITISGGIAMYCTGDDPQSVLRRADAALYRAKHAGRNQVCLHESAAGSLVDGQSADV